jgi:membrane-bound lytic murein transglycosylase D
VYVPKLLAVAAIVANPEKYNVKLPPITDKPYFAEVKTTKPVDLTRVAKTTGINVETLHTLNPDYKHAPVPKKEKGYSILVPVNLEPRVRAQLGDKILG